MHARAFCPVLAVVCLAGAALASAQSADLMVTKSGPATADAGTNVTHAVTVTNLGPDDASTVALQQAIPSGMTFVSWSQVDGPSYSCSTPPVGSGSTVLCTIATHPIAQPVADFSTTLAIPADTPGGTVFTDIATSSSPSDQNSENDEGVAGRMVRAAVAAGARGMVLAGVGDGNASKDAIDAPAEAVRKGVVVVRATRTGSGIVRGDIELDDDALGFVAALDLNPRKARVLLRLALTQTHDAREVQRIFEQY